MKIILILLTLTQVSVLPKLAGVKEVRGSYRPLKRAKKLKPIAQVYGRFLFAELSALTSNGAKRSDNFRNFLTPKGILNPKLKTLKYQQAISNIVYINSFTNIYNVFFNSLSALSIINHRIRKIIEKCGKKILEEN